ncbi:Ribosomal RNA small subunit methyltransferase J [Kluyvera cryocrescens]|uniref:Ribosomal RNA small subunit methyltransferase J n=1 Tax=Kluyvera cryocrescens TaxID=580 RepID=A0A485AF56_KLUCR|nr:Ribosomal RNA small subunit methyltransferase J [Kluyvera cryocrescens]
MKRAPETAPYSVLAARWGLEQDDDNLMALVMTPEHLELRKRDEPKLGGIFG